MRNERWRKGTRSGRSSKNEEHISASTKRPLKHRRSERRRKNKAARKARKK